MVFILPTFKGYTVDIRLEQFRKIKKNGGLIFVDFTSQEGDELLAEFVKSLNKKSDRKTVLEIMDSL